MKCRSMIALDFILVITFALAAQAQDARLKSKVTAFYETVDWMYAEKNLDGYMALFADDFQILLAGAGRDVIQAAVKKMFDENAEMRARHTILEIAPYGDRIGVVFDQKVEGKPADGDWKTIAENTVIEFLVQQNDSLRLSRSAEFDKSRMSCIAGRAYKDNQSGFSFTVPENWAIIPSKHVTLQGIVLVAAPDMSSSALFGYLKAPGINAQQVLELDEAATTKLSAQGGVYKLLKSGPITVDAADGFETESQFSAPSLPERHRRRVYLNAPGGALFVLAFDAIPADQWDQVKDGFQSLLNSMKFAER